MKASKSKRYFWAVTVTCLPESREALSYWLFSLGALGCEEVENRIIAYFEDQDEHALHQAVIRGVHRIRESGLPVDPQSIDLHRFPEENWMENWKRYFRPVRIGDVLCIRPPWHRAASPPMLDIMIEPKQAFGTGTHATTQLVLQAMVERRDRLPEQALDVGTGSGILAIAHAKLRPGSRVVGIDIDPVAVENARENARLNGVAAACDFRVGSIEAADERTYRLIYANLEKNIISRLMEALLQRLQPAGEILFSGILARERAELEKLLVQHGLRVTRVRQQDDWLLMETEKPHV